MMPLQSLWLELSLDGASRRFEFPPDCLTAITVGADRRADVQLQTPGVAPLHFHIEREGDALVVVPAYGSMDLRVDTVQLTKPRVFAERAVIEFANIRLDARVFDVARQARSTMASATRGESSKLAVPFSARGPAVAIQGLATIEPEPHEHPILVKAPVTTARHARHSLFSATVRVRRFTEPPTQDTVRMDPFWVTHSAGTPSGDDMGRPTSSRGTEPQSSTLDATQTEERHTDSPCAQDTTLFDPVQAPQPPLGSVVLTADRNARNETVAIRHEGSKPPAGLLVLLGRFSIRRPTLVIGGSVLVFALSACFGFLIRGIQRPPQRHASTSSSTGSASISQVTRVNPEATAAADSTQPSAAAEQSTFAPVSFAIIPKESSATVQRKGTPQDPELVQAVGHLFAARYEDARRAYAALSNRANYAPVLESTTRLISKRLAPKCSAVSPAENVACPEVLP